MAAGAHTAVSNQHDFESLNFRHIPDPRYNRTEFALLGTAPRTRLAAIPRSTKRSIPSPIMDSSLPDAMVKSMIAMMAESDCQSDSAIMIAIDLTIAVAYFIVPSAM